MYYLVRGGNFKRYKLKHFRRNVTKNARYSDGIWHSHNNPNFLISGQLSGFDSIDYRYFSRHIFANQSSGRNLNDKFPLNIYIWTSGLWTATPALFKVEVVIG